MIITMSRDSDPMTRKDGQRLSKINLTTKLLEGSKYATISFMNDVITAIKNGVQSTQNVEPNIDFTYPTTVFDNDIGIDDPDDDDEVDDHPKWQKILINTPQDWMIATLLDPRCKSLNFANESQKNQTKALFREIYNEKRQELNTIQQQQSLSPDNTINSLLQDIFTNRHRRERQDEIDEYMMIEEIDVSTCPFKWWASQESQFPILSQLAKKYLAILATSAASERLFSDAGNVMTVKRTNLSPTTFEHLIFCKRNWHLIGRIFPE
ncbi:unnamed protein product [Rhizophagus irregularis]|nr:unnamed protein product [Rhizophagus irregularis]